MRDTNRVTTFLAASVVLVGVAAALGGPSGAAAAPGPGSPGTTASAATASDAERWIGIDPAVAGRVVLSEVTPAGAAGSGDGFFELVNPTEHPVDLSAYAVYRCDGEGLRARPTDPEAELSGVTLAPGERRAFRTARLSERGYGLVVIGPSGATVDAIAVYPDDPAPMMSECGGRTELPVTTAAALDESWQRVEGAPRSEERWLRAPATPGAVNALPQQATSSVRIDEIAAAGPGGHGDDFVELTNTGSTEVELAGWRLYRCTATGAAPTEALQHRFGDGDALAPGERLVVGGPAFAESADVRTTTSLADTVSGVLLVTADGRRVDGVGVSSHEDTACQTGRGKLPSVLDYRTGHSWQRQPAGGFAIAARTPGTPNVTPAPVAASVSAFSYPQRPGVVVSEIANDPVIDGMPRRNFVELANVGDADVDISGWRLIACGVDGFRRFDDLAVAAPGTVLAPDETWTATLRGTPLAGEADARFGEPLELAGAGVWLEDAEGRRVDSVGIYHRNEMDRSVDRESPCTKGMALSTFAVDRLRGETLQRVGFTGDDATDFAPAPATAGVRAWPGSPSADDMVARALDLARADAVGDAAGSAAASRAGRLEAAQGAPVEVVAAFAGSSPAPLARLDAPGEQPVAADALASRDDAYGLPYVRMRVALPPAGGTLAWHGRTVGRAQLRLSVWEPSSATAPSGAWRTVDEAAGEATATDAAADAPVTLEGSVRRAEVVDGVADLLVQVVPREETAVARADGIAAPADYDLAVGHLTDTQYYSEAYPEVYAAQVAWLAENADARKIAFVTHTGDLIQNWVDPAQPEDRARREYELASRMQAVLDVRGIANSVLPGNHDNKRGVSNALFNDYFGPARYRDQPWYGGSLSADDNGANWSGFQAGGARFVMISLPYAYGEREVAWAQEVVADHPEANIVISTHEHLTPATGERDAERSTTSRWVSHGDLLWDRVVAPNRNVVLVLSGHFHGVGAIVTHNAGGIPGHTVLEVLGDYQEFRTPTGERATGFQRLLQIDLASGVLAVDTFSVPLAATASHPYDYVQFLPDDGDAATPSNERPWRILAEGLQQRYTAADDAFSVPLALQHAKAIETDAVTSVRP
ncbi:lamin tail domain-containing protein [Microbacterium ureisolvens]|uniref:lamin tail domain-containing protein n=1 Tax=Microbacterium ureisolvens TaxID=2781186 RepID=UPI00362FB6E0